MATTAPETPGAGATIAALVDGEGSGAHPHLATLGRGVGSDHIADCVHFLFQLHGRHPGVIDLAADRVSDAPARAWLARAAAGFAAERAYLTRLVIAAGPVPRRVGHARAEAAAAGQLQALSILARSERQGTALGAAFALVLDWATIRAVLDEAAIRFGQPAPPCDLPGHHATTRLADAIGAAPGIRRALAFGAQQLLHQHQGLWDLLEVRAGTA